MSIQRSSVVALALLLTVACDSGTKDAKPEGAKAAAPESKPTPPAAGPGAAANPHGGNPHGSVAPHAGANNPGANPHGAMPPMMAKAKKPAGPPRDITPSGETAAQTLPGLTFAVPSEWEKGTPANSMRLAQWVLPGPGGDAELVVFRFPGGAGGIEANVKRWKNMFTPPEGKTLDDVSSTKEIAGEGGLTTSLVDVHGTYVAAMSPGSDEKHNDAGSRMLAAIVSGSGDPFYFKAVGPKATMDLWSDPYAAMVASFAKAEAGAVAPTGAPAGDKAAPPAGDPPATPGK